MPRGGKGAYTDKQKRQAPRTKENYVERGLSDDEADARAWAIVNKASSSGKAPDFGRKQSGNKRKGT